MILVFDVGGTGVKYGVSEEQGRFCLRDSFETPAAGLETFLDKIREIFLKTSKQWDIQGAAFSFPGEVHSREGIIRGISAVPYIHDVELKKLLSQRLGGFTVTMANDAKCAAMGELWKGVARNCKNVVFVICGTGIGGAVVEHGQLYKGVTMNRGEFGNFPMGGFKDGVLLTWSDYTLEKQARKYRKRKGIEEIVTGKELVCRSMDGDGLATELLEEFYYWMAVGCITLEFSFDPEMIAIGGGISANADIIRGIRLKTEELLDGQRSGYLRPNICACTNGNQANLYGALYYYLYHDQLEHTI